MRKEGKVVRWDDARGFGFIRSPASTSDVFFHIKDYGGARAMAPRHGLAVTFEEIHVGGKGPRAMAVHPAGPASAGANPSGPVRRDRRPQRAQQRATSSGAMFALPLMVAHAAAVAWGAWTHRLPWWVLVALPLLNFLAFFAYWQDKYAAGKGRWRTSEGALHLWSLAGAWPGAWFAQQVLRHKSVKKTFRDTYWATVFLHCAALAAWLWWLAPRWPM
jgi:uncharacterized membrane protein YsdA (DUF1294 family)/cold shock CspA family protein